jgi:hypothetical protein
MKTGLDRWKIVGAALWFLLFFVIGLTVGGGLLR